MELADISLRDKIQLLEDQMKQLPQISIQPDHFFCKGLYARSLVHPAGVLITGKVHKKEHMFMLVSGDITVWTEDGMKRIRGPYLVKSLPGTKRVAYAHVDSLVIAFVPTDMSENDSIEEVEQSMVCDTIDQFLEYQRQLEGGE